MNIFAIFLTCWTTPINISNTPGTYSMFPCIVVNHGKIHVVWDDGIYDVMCRVFYRCCVNDSWLPIDTVVDSLPYYCGIPSIAVDTSGVVHVVWDDTRGNYDIWWSYYDGEEWSPPVNISNDPRCSFAPKIVVDPSNRLFVFWHDYSGHVWYTCRDGDTWSIPDSVPVNRDIAWPDVAVDSEGRLHVVWMDYDDYDVYYAMYDGESWSTPVNISNLEGQSCDPRIAVDSENRPYVVWEQRSNGYWAYYSYCDDSGWHMPYCLGYGFEPSIAADLYNNIHVIWNGRNWEIWYTRWNGETWDSIIDISTPNRRSMSPDICTDREGNPYAVWLEGGDVYFSKHIIAGIIEYTHSKIVAIYGKGEKIKLFVDIPTNGDVNLIITDILGRTIWKLPLDRMIKGKHTLTVNLKDLSAGVYFCHITYKSKIIGGEENVSE